MSRRSTEAEIAEVWERPKAGEPTRSIARRLRRNGLSIRRLFEDSGGVRPARCRRAERHLTLLEGEEISRGVAAGDSLRVIANRLGRAHSTVSRELARNGPSVTQETGRSTGSRGPLVQQSLSARKLEGPVRAAYVGYNEHVQSLLDEVLELLPADVNKFAGSDCTFFSIGRAQGGGQAYPTKALRNAAVKAHTDLWIVLLCEDTLLGTPRPHAAHTVVHEIAHAWLGSIGDDRYADHETVDALAARWLADSAKSGQAGTE